ncbi:hypothetical protein B0G83_12958 [Paraburkholderia sp. BL21I4N1]|nr:hypothetical protein B0G83_12958 [Paraburkholderia sp. BL21I4N1]
MSLKTTAICLLRCSRLQVSSIIDCCLSLMRYTDDFVITGHSKELLEDELEDELKPLVEVFL